jgi:tetratricopeptide (TPR) repeat protein
MNPWLTILDQITLSRSEKEVVLRYQKDPSGLSFLAIAEILKNHDYLDESLEILAQGVRRHPRYTAARVVLARDLFQKGLMSESWVTLDEAGSTLSENVLAQKLRFKLAIVLNYEALARATFHHMKRQEMVDHECARFGEMITTSGFQKAHQMLTDELKSQGLVAIFPEQPMNELCFQGDLSEVGTGGLEGGDFSDKVETAASGFSVMSLQDVFRHSEQRDGYDFSPNGIELDSTTLAEIYESQQHFAKALEVYKRLLQMTPSNDYLRNRVVEMTKKLRAQRQQDANVDKSLTEKMEQLEIINRQIIFYSNLLERVGNE